MASRLFLVNGVLFVGILASAACGSIGSIHPLQRSASAGLIILFSSVSAALIWAKALQVGSLLLLHVSARKEEGLKEAMIVCFSGLWFVPRGCLVRVCVLRWSRNVLRHGATVQTALISSYSAAHLWVGSMAWMTACLLAYVELPSASHGAAFDGWAQSVFTVLFIWIANLFFFHWFLRTLLVDKPSRLTRPTSSERHAAFAHDAATARARR